MGEGRMGARDAMSHGDISTHSRGGGGGTRGASGPGRPASKGAASPAGGLFLCDFFCVFFCVLWFRLCVFIHGNDGSRRAQTHEWRTAAWYFLCWHFFLDHSLHSEVSGLAVWGGNGLEVCVLVNVRHISLHCNTLQFYQHEVAKGWRWVCPSQCTILQHAALHCITLQLISIWWQEVASHRNG